MREIAFAQGRDSAEEPLRSRIVSRRGAARPAPTQTLHRRVPNEQSSAIDERRSPRRGDGRRAGRRADEGRREGRAAAGAGLARLELERTVADAATAAGRGE